MTRPLHKIAEEILADWPKARSENHPAGAYAVPLLSLESVRDPYYSDTGASVVRGFLGNAQSWRGDTARRIKAELRSLL